MHATVEYMVAGAAIFVMMAVTTTTTVSLSYVYVTQMRDFRLTVLAERIVDTVLLQPGYPRRWGVDLSINSTDTGGLAEFGLSVANGTIYRLDPDKVARLCNGSASDPFDNYYYVPPDTAVDLLGLGRDYGFRLSILPIFKVAANTSPGDTVLHLNVSNQDGVDVHSANVTVTAFWSLHGKEKLANATLSGITDWRGRCQLDFAGMGPGGEDPDLDKATFLIATDLHGLRVFTAVSTQEILDATVVADRLLVRFPETGGPQGAVHIIDGPKLLTYPYVFNAMVTSDRTINKGAKSYREYRLAEVDSYCNAVLLIVKKTGTYWVVVAERPRPSIYQTQEAQPPHASTVSRLVEINGFDYFVRFTLWRMSE